MRAARRSTIGLALLAVLATSRAHATTPGELFQAGNSAYERGDFQGAADTYEKIVGYGFLDPRVLYNLANAEYKLGRLGAAILYYERALRLDPSDKDIRDNLEFARGQIRDRVPESETPYPVKVLQNFLDALPSTLVNAVFLCAYFGAAALIGALPLTVSETRRRALGYGAAAVGLCSLLAGGALAYRVQSFRAPQAIVMTDRVDVLSGPSAENTVLFTVHEGTRLELRNRTDGWYQVSLPNAMNGWIPAAAVERV